MGGFSFVLFFVVVVVVAVVVVNNNYYNNNNNVHLLCAHQHPERSHDTY